MIQSTQSSLAIPELRVCKPVALLSPMFHEVATEELSEKPLACLLTLTHQAVCSEQRSLPGLPQRDTTQGQQALPSPAL